MIEVRRSSDRGHANFGWLDSRHSFSFGRYYDPAYMGFRALRVINEDHVKPGQGFGTHGHQNMEIISYVVDGALGHKDSEGNGSTIHHGEVQLMSAGRGIRHSEMNGSAADPVHFLQIWIIPDVNGEAPGYQQKDFPMKEGVELVVSPDGRNGSLKIKQDVDLYRVLAPADADLSIELRHPQAWVQVVRGELKVDGETLHAGDGAAIAQIDPLDLHTQSEVEALVFDLN